MEPEKRLADNHKKALRQLAWAIENSQGSFKLILAKCNYESLRSHLIENLREVCQVEISILQLQKSETKLFAAIYRKFSKDVPAALMVLGLESVQELPQILINANQVRGDFRQHFSFPLILWINDDIYRQLMEFAPDLESWTTSKNFPIERGELANYWIDIGKKWFNNNLCLNQDDYCVKFKSELTAAIKYLSIKTCFDTSEVKAYLDSLLGYTCRLSNELDSAIENYQKALNYWQKENNLEYQAKILAEICICYYLKVIKIRDKTNNAWQETRNFIQDYLNLIYENKHIDLVKNYGFEIGEILRNLEAWEEIKNIFKQLKTRHKREQEQQYLAIDYGFLAQAYLGKNKFEYAYRYIRKALIVLSELFFPDVTIDKTSLESFPILNFWKENIEYISELANTENDILSKNGNFYLFILAKAQFNLDEKTEAIENFKLAKKISDPRNDLKLYLDILEKLHELYLQQNEYFNAFKIKQEKLSVEQQFGLRAFIGPGKLRSSKVGGFLEHPRNGGTIAPEIDVSNTRKSDVDKLVERVKRTDYKLTVIYGPSGVGKSSLLNAGLAPVLRNNPIGGKDNFPVIIGMYTNWQYELAQKLGFREKELNNEKLLYYLRELENKQKRTILIFDQFEEFFFVSNNPSDRKDFFRFIANCLDILSLKIILSLRIDYLHYLLEFNKISSTNIICNDILNKDILYELANFQPEDAKSIIKYLSGNSNFSLEEDLVEKFVQDLSGTLEEVSPIELQILGAQLQTKNIHRLKEYCNLGDNPTKVLVKDYIDEVVGDCGKENHQLARTLLYYLTEENETRPLKTRVDLEKDLREVEISSDNLNLVLNILVGSGLVLHFKEKPHDRYQLVHDYIAKFIYQQEQQPLNELKKELKNREEKLKKINKLLIFFLRILVVVTIVICGMTIWSFMEKHEVNKAKKIAEITKIEAQIESTESFFTSGETRKASIIALEVAEKLKQGKGETTNNQIQILTTAALRQAVYSNYRIIKLTTLKNDEKPIKDLAWIPDIKKRETLDTKTKDDTIKYLNTTGKTIEPTDLKSKSINKFAWNFDGKTLASADKDGTIKIWTWNKDKSHYERIQTLSDDNKPVNVLAWSPIEKDKTNQILASASKNGKITLWDVSRKLTQIPDEKVQWTWNNNRTWDIEEKTLAFADNERNIKIQDADGKLIKTLSGHNGKVNSIAWNPDDKTLLSGSGDGTIKLWDIDSGKLIRTLHGGNKRILGVAWSPDGKKLAFMDQDEKITEWDFDYDGLVEKACIRLKNYFVFHPEQLQSLGECQQHLPSILPRAAEILVIQGEEEARNGNVEVAVEKFRLAKKWNPQFKFDPEKKASELKEKITDNPSEFD